jgi:hypothetical protein
MANQAAQSATKDVRRRRLSAVTLAAFAIGLPLGLVALALVYRTEHYQGPLYHPEVYRYVSHPVEVAEVLLFFCGMAALLAKAILQWGERRALRHPELASWDGQPLPAGEAAALHAGLSGIRQTLLTRRVTAVLDFVRARGSANDLDDQLRTLSDNDALAVEGSYSLVRFITWAIPILGFLGTVLGITDAIAGVTPETLEQSLTQVTGGLATAFDTTALALGLTMVLMLSHSLVERLEQGTLELVDAYVDTQLAHRFERTGAEGGEFGEALRKNTQVLLRATEQLIERQASVWARSLEKADRQWAEGAVRQQEQLVGALEAALERTLTSHNRRLQEMERQTLERSKGLLDGMSALAAAVGDTGRKHHAALSQVTQALTAQAGALARLQEGESQLVRLQELLQQNLATLAGSGAFEQAVQSLTAAIHLLTARTGSHAGRGPWSAAA